MHWRAFSECMALKQISFFNFLTRKEDNVKNNNLWLNIEQIKDYAFYNTSIQNKLEFSVKLTHLGKSVFDGCSQLKDVKFFSGSLAKQQILNDGTFSNCKTLLRVELNSSIKIIGQSCFAGCAYLDQFK